MSNRLWNNYILEILDLVNDFVSHLNEAQLLGENKGGVKNRLAIVVGLFDSVSVE